MKWLIFLILSLCQIGLAQDKAIQADSFSNICIFTMAKGGTHLLKKAIYLFSGTELNLNQTEIINDKTVYFNHLWPTTPTAIKTNPTILKILLVRDPRDMLISQLHWICYAMNWGGDQLSSDELNRFYSLSTEEKISFLINFPNHAFGMTVLSKVFSSWKDEPSVMMIRFEDLIGPRGGGTLEKQEACIHKLSQALGYDLSGEEIRCISEKLFGDTITFREGKIGGWKEYFNEDHKILFKEVAGIDLITLGYESDDQW